MTKDNKCQVCGCSDKAHRKLIKEILELDGVTEVYQTEVLWTKQKEGLPK